MPSLMKTTNDGTRVLSTYRGESRMVVDAGPEGFLRRVITDVRLDAGPDLYQAKSNAPYHIWGRGPAKIVAAMGGELIWMPRYQDNDGNWHDGFQVIRDDNGAIKRVEAWAICRVRHPMTGVWTVAIDRATEDLESMLRNELSNLPSSGQQPCIRVTSYRKSQELADEGWLVLPYTAGGVYLCADPAQKAVLDALRKFDKMCDLKVLEGRIKSKAMRRAFLANGVTRQVGSFDPGQLRQVIGDDGKPQSALCVVVPVPCWVEYERKEQINKFLIQVQQEAMQGDPVMLLPEPEEEIPLEAYTEQPDDAREPLGQVVKAAPVAEPVKAAEPEPQPEVRDEADERVIATCADYEADMSQGEVEQARRKAGIGAEASLYDLSADKVAAYLAELKKMEG